jgi:hypothetical protein
MAKRRVFTANLEIAGPLRYFCYLVIFLMVFCEGITAQETEVLPEVDIYVKLNSNMRLRGQVQNAREGSDPTQLTIGPDLDFYLKPLIRLKEVAAFDLDDAKSRPLVLSAGYRLLATPGSLSTNRIVLTVTSHLPLKRWLLISDRNRADLDWSDGKFKWRYRNRLDVEKPMTIHSYHPAPYSSVEVYYEEQYRKWSTTEIDVGCLFPLGKHFELDPYYKHQNNTGKSPNQQLNGIGLILDAYF